MSTNNSQFYANLPVNNISIGRLFISDELFYSVPDDWFVIITDIKNSTDAVLDGAHQNVNLIATGSIVSVLNIAYKADITVPFFFGGDGATFMVPPVLIDEVMQALLMYKNNTLTNFNIELRAGTIPAKQIYDAGYKLRISKYCNLGNFTIPIVLGDGLSYAEKQIKGEDYDVPDYQAKKDKLDLSGMQCRWDKIAPPKNTDEVLTLLVVALHEDKQPEIFKEVMCHIDEIYGDPQQRQPISVSQLRLKSTFDRLNTEMLARLGKVRLLELIQVWFTMLPAYFYFRTKKGESYLKRLVEMSDTLVIDGKINTVISGTAAQREKLQQVLNKLEAEGEIYYGFHVSRESIMSCYVRDLDDGHIHFVDGGEGGYTKAASFVKRKLAK